MRLEYDQTTELMDIPYKLGKCPIAEAILEIRFNPVVDHNTVFPILYGAFREDFPTIEQLIPSIPGVPIPGFPDMSLQPHYRLKHKEDANVLIQIGPRILTINMAPSYEGWSVFRKYAIKYIAVLNDAKIVGSVDRVGYRVINFFGDDIFLNSRLNLKVTLGDAEIPYRETSVRTIFDMEGITSVVNLMNNGQLNHGMTVQRGSIIDVDTFILNCANFMFDFENRINEVHDAEKRTFFPILSADYIKTFDPSYEE